MESIYAMKYKRWFHGIFVKNRVSKIISYPRHSVEKWEIHCHANFFTSNQFIVKFFSKTLIWRNFCDKTVAVKFRNFQCARTLWSLRNLCITIFWKISMKTTSLVKSFNIQLISRNNSQVIQKFRNLYTVPHAHSMEKLEILCNANIFPSNQFRGKFLCETLVSRNFREK